MKNKPIKKNQSAPEKNMREKIKQAAFLLMAEKGLEKVSMREIAEAVQVTKPVLYYYFKNKEDLCASIMEDHKDSYGKKLEKAGQNATGPEDIVYKGLLSHLDFFTKNAINSKFIIQMISYTLAADKISPRGEEKSPRLRLEEVLAKQVEKGNLPKKSLKDVVTLAGALASDMMFMAYFHQHLSKKMGKKDRAVTAMYTKEEINRLVKIILLGVKSYYNGRG